MALGLIVCPLFYSAVASPARALTHEYISRGHLGLVEGAELARAAVGAQDIVAPRGARLAAGHAVRPHQAVAGKDRRGHRLEEAQLSHGAVAAPPAPAAAPAAPGSAIRAPRDR